MPLTTAERATLLEPCACGHSFEDHGSACWECTTCKRTFEELLCERVATIVEGRTSDINLLIELAEEDA